MNHLWDVYESIRAAIDSELAQDPGFDLVVYGSAANGLFEQQIQQCSQAMQSSDLDLTLVSRGEFLKTMEEQLELLKKVRKILDKAHNKGMITLTDENGKICQKPPKNSVIPTKFGALLELKVRV